MTSRKVRIALLRTATIRLAKFELFKLTAFYPNNFHIDKFDFVWKMDNQVPPTCDRID